jgi:uncharacterized damage-inducible protein DinB
MKKTEWFNRKFPVIEDIGLLLSIIERLAGTPARLEEIVHRADPNALVLKKDDKWSVKEEAGHLSDLEPLWLGRLGDLANGLKALRVADLTNRRTHEANHNSVPIEILLQRFREQRLELVDRLMQLDEEQLTHAALHPRLGTPMRIMDLAYFVAEHDDHHLASIRNLLFK